MQIRELEPWQELDDKQAQRISGGAEGTVSWSIGFSDVVRPTDSEGSTPDPPGTIAPASGKIRGTLLF